jgi:hypothetical protein
MTHRVAARVAAFTAVLCCVTLGQAAVASASSKSIKAAIVSYGAKIEASEAHIETAVKEYEQSQNPAGVEAALGEAAAVLGALEKKVAHQSARTPRVKRARAKIVHGLHTIVLGYKVLSTAYEEKATNQEAANADAAHSVVVVKSGKHELNEGVKLLS